MTSTDQATADGRPGPEDPRPAPYRPGPVRYRWTFVEMLVSSLIGLYASLVLSIEAITLAKDPFADLSCNISTVLSCGTVGSSWQASLLGFPNAYLGLIAEPVVITIAVAALGGVRFPRWFMNSAQVVYSIGLVFAYWLFYQSYFVIGALCPWCLLITLTTTTVFMSLTRVNLLDNTFGLPAGAYRTVASWLKAGADTLGVIVIFALLIAAIVLKYGGELFA
ncbi:MAG: vitamin K epoxide reductase family protein [Actinomycetota bacterium]|nr:vitamin K epoxide reductase family protein [Actinomycetota bacterium]